MLDEAEEPVTLEQRIRELESLEPFWSAAAEEQIKENERLTREARAFVDFVLRHTRPERALAHGAETVHSVIKHHPFAKAHATPHSAPASGDARTDGGE